MDKPIAQTMAIVIPAYRMHSQLFNNMITDIREEDAQKRIEDRTNHFTWMAGNLVNCRYWLGEVLGLSLLIDHQWDSLTNVETSKWWSSFKRPHARNL